MNPFIDDSGARYQDRLDEVARWRLVRLVSANRPSRFDRLRRCIGEHLIALGQHLKAVARPAPQFD